MSNSDAFALLCQHIILGLPDSMAGRRALLAALLACAPPDCPLLPRVREAQWYLEQHGEACRRAGADPAGNPAKGAANP